MTMKSAAAAMKRERDFPGTVDAGAAGMKSMYPIIKSF
ncbi:hypothetical protein L21SP2_0171 [Salinispira pacifica]|uniref:Uncharacterized protein n=1 Tax=Salinispira pacifica TaxID=1307761 RepID=V5WDD8_9SPIO|nr:hypothetical protein L21SP2_0171 [Salinispira pacifica]